MKWMVGILLFITNLFAHQLTGKSDPREYIAEGNLLILRLVPGDKTAKLYVVGRKVAEIDLKKDMKILSVFLNTQNPETLGVNATGSYYEIQNVPRDGKPYELSIRTEVKGKVEDIKIKVNTNTP